MHALHTQLYVCELSAVGMGCLIIATGIPVYLICVKWKSKPQSFNRLLGIYVSRLHCVVSVFINLLCTAGMLFVFLRSVHCKQDNSGNGEISQL